MRFALFASAVFLCTSVVAQQQPAAPAAGAPPQAQPQPQGPPLRVYIHAGLKTHAEGQRDAGYLSMEDRATLDNFLRRGGGVVSFHDALCGPDPEHFSSIVGGGKKHGEVNYTLEADVPYTVADAKHPIMQGVTDFTIKDEAFFNMTWSKTPEIHVLATAVMAKTPSAGTHAGEVVPQLWTYEKSLLPGAQPFRAFVWMQGHNYVNFSHPQVQPMLLRGIAWAAKYPVDALATERPQGRGRGRGTGR
jgi:type 1 glutamine amidotransferase